jgi:hypothetical protein
MDASLNNALSQPNVDDILLSAADHADRAIRRYIWRGFRPKWGPKRELMVGDKTAQDFVNEALRRLCNGKRIYNPERTLLDNLNSITDSLISSEKKSSDRTGIVDFAQPLDGSDDCHDPLATKSGNVLSADELMLENERCEAQRKCFALIKASFDGDKDTQEYLDALSQGFFEIEEISTLTDIPVTKIYEIRRKLKKYAPRFFGVTNVADLERKIENPEK